MANSRSEAQRWQQTRPRSENAHRKLKRFLWLLAAPLALFSFPALAAKWDIVPSLSLEETYSDNVSMAPSALKQSDWITQFSPGISIAATGIGLRFKAIYDPQVIYYAQGQRGSEVFQRGNAAGTVELGKQLLFVDFGAKIDQYDASLQAPLTTSNANITGNRATVRTYYASPFLRRTIGADVRAEARLTGSVVDSDHPSSLSNSSSSLSDSVADRIDLSLKSGPSYKLMVWDLDFYREAINYRSGQVDTVTEVMTANARRLITSTVGLLVHAGYDYYDTGNSASVLKGTSWSAGFEWSPSPTTRFAATAGQQFYGDTYSLDFYHRTRLTTWSAVYSQYVTTTRSEFFVPPTASTAGYLDALFSSQFPDPAARQKAVQEFIARTGLPPSLGTATNFFTSELFVVKKWQASAGILGVWNVLIVNLFKETREALDANLARVDAGDFAVSNTITQTGASFQWNWRMTTQNAFNLGGKYNRNEFPGTSRIDNLKYVGMGLTRQFQQRLSGSLNYRRQQNDSSESAASYTENAVFATLQMRF